MSLSRVGSEIISDFQIGSFEPGDYPRLSEIYHSNFPEYGLSADEMRRDDETWDYKKYVLKRFVASFAGRVEAFAEYWQSPVMYHPRKFTMTIIVDPARQRAGIGSALFAHILKQLHPLNAMLLRTRTREDMAASNTFLRNRGFSELSRDWESRLRLAEFSAEPFRDYTERAASNGITITTLAEELKRGTDCYRNLHEIWMEKLGQDIPLPDAYTPISYEDFMARIAKGPNFVRDGCFIARVEDRYVGISCCGRSEKEPHDLYQWMTGVLKEYRGRGIAIALKLKVIDFAARNGYEVIKTWNSSLNEAMLGINRKLGFRRHVGWINYEKQLS